MKKKDLLTVLDWALRTGMDHQIDIELMAKTDAQKNARIRELERTVEAQQRQIQPPADSKRVGSAQRAEGDDDEGEAEPRGRRR